MTTEIEIKTIHHRNDAGYIEDSETIVSYWSVYEQRRLEVPASSISDRELAAMPEADRVKVLSLR